MIDLVMVLKEASPDVLYYPSYYLVNNDYYINTGLLSKICVLGEQKTKFCQQILGNDVLIKLSEHVQILEPHPL